MIAAELFCVVSAGAFHAHPCDGATMRHRSTAPTSTGVGAFTRRPHSISGATSSRTAAAGRSCSSDAAVTLLSTANGPYISAASATATLSGSASITCTGWRETTSRRCESSWPSGGTARPSGPSTTAWRSATRPLSTRSTTPSTTSAVSWKTAYSTIPARSAAGTLRRAICGAWERCTDARPGGSPKARSTAPIRTRCWMAALRGRACTGSVYGTSASRWSSSARRSSPTATSRVRTAGRVS